jgi:hypothetical protein
MSDEPEDIATVNNLIIQHIDAAIQFDNRAMQILINQFLVNNNWHRSLNITNTQDPHLRQNNVFFACRCAREFPNTNSSMPSYQLSLCCGMNCHYHRIVITCLRVDQIEAIYKLIYSDAFRFNHFSDDSMHPDR